MRAGIGSVWGTPEALAPTVVLGCGLVVVAGYGATAESPVSRVLSGLAAVSLLVLWWMVRRQRRALSEMRQTLGCLREETITRRSTMRFMFDELLDDSGPLRAEVIRTRHRLRTSLSVASGFLDLVCEETRFREPVLADAYLIEVRRAVAQSDALAAELGGKDPGPRSESGRSGGIDE